MRALQVLSLITCILFSKALLSQTKNYEEQWKKSDEFIEKKNDDIQKPAYAFEISQEQAIAPANQFVKYNFTTKDSLSLQQKALLIYHQCAS